MDLHNEEELLKLRKRCQMRGKILMAAVLTTVIEKRDYIAHHHETRL
jgi:hypothetical protein